MQAELCKKKNILTFTEQVASKIVKRITNESVTETLLSLIVLVIPLME